MPSRIAPTANASSNSPPTSWNDSSACSRNESTACFACESPVCSALLSAPIFTFTSCPIRNPEGCQSLHSRPLFIAHYASLSRLQICERAIKPNDFTQRQRHHFFFAPSGFFNQRRRL